MSTSPSSSASAQAAKDRPTIARSIAQAVLDKRYEDARGLMGETLKNALTAERLASDIQKTEVRSGKCTAIDGLEEKFERGYHTVRVDLRCANGGLTLNVVFAKDTTVASGMWLRPREVAWSAPAYAKPDAVTEERFEVPGASPLPGLLTKPKSEGKHPFVVLVHGSGPNDRDETIGGARPFADLAAGLAAQGIIVARFDKRTKVAPISLGASFDLDDEVTKDARAIANLFHDRAEVDASRIVIVGHSLGAQMAPRIAKGQPYAGIVMLAAPTRGTAQLMQEQTRYIMSVRTADPKSIDEAVKTLRDELDAAAAKTGKDDEMVKVMGIAAPRKYWRDWLSYDARKPLTEQPQLPVYVAQGARDYQVTTVDFDGWKKALEGRTNATLKLYPGLDHRLVRGDAPSTPDDYATPGHVDAELVDDLAKWILALPPHTESVAPGR